MFPDPTLRWRPYPSVMDGLHAPPHVLNHGLWKGILYLIVFGQQGASETFGVQIKCSMFFGYEEFLDQRLGHSDQSGHYLGSVYIKEAETSALLTSFMASDAERFMQSSKRPRHFLFVGGDYCYECVGYSEPVIRTFETEQQALDWKPGPIEQEV